MVKKIASFEICSFFPRPTWHLKSVLDFFPIMSGCTLPGAAPWKVKSGMPDAGLPFPPLSVEKDGHISQNDYCPDTASEIYL